MRLPLNRTTFVIATRPHPPTCFIRLFYVKFHLLPGTFLNPTKHFAHSTAINGTRVVSAFANQPSSLSSSGSQPPTSHPPAYPRTRTYPRASTTASSASSSPPPTPQTPQSTKPSYLSASTPSTRTPCVASRFTSCTPSPPTSTARR
jgi:hypothetical protein